jgi:hypothetical protein
MQEPPSHGDKSTEFIIKTASTAAMVALHPASAGPAQEAMKVALPGLSTRT